MGVAPPASASASSRCFIVLVLRFSAVFATMLKCSCLVGILHKVPAASAWGPPYAASLCKAAM